MVPVPLSSPHISNNENCLRKTMHEIFGKICFARQLATKANEEEISKVADASRYRVDLYSSSKFTTN